MEDKNKFKDLSLEELLAKLDTILKKLEQEELPLEKAVELYSEGALITKIAQQKINNLQERIKVIKENLISGEYEEQNWE